MHCQSWPGNWLGVHERCYEITWLGEGGEREDRTRIQAYQTPLTLTHTHTRRTIKSSQKQQQSSVKHQKRSREQPQIASFSPSPSPSSSHASPALLTPPPPPNRQMQMWKMRFDITVSVCVCVCGDSCKTHFKSKSGTSIISPRQVVESWQHISFLNTLHKSGFQNRGKRSKQLRQIASK